MSFVVKAVKSVAKAVGNVITGVVKAVGKVISSVVNFVASPFMGLFGTPNIPNDSAEADRQQGILVQQVGSNINIPVVYGYRKIAGVVTFAETGADSNKYLWVVYTFAEGAVEGLREIFIDDTQLDSNVIAPLNAGQAITLTTGKYKDRVLLQFFQGTFYNNPADSPVGTRAITRESPSWRPTMAHNGLVTLFARYEWKEVKTQEDADNNPFPGGIPQVQMCVLGRKVASLIATDTENYNYAGSGYTERYSTNPAEILLDYLRNPRYGKGLKNSEIDWNAFRISAAKCNQTVTYINGIKGPILTTNVVVDTGQTIFSNTKMLLSNFRGYLPFIQGKYKLKIEDAGNETDILSGSATIVKTFNKDNITGSITYTGIDRGSKYNQVVVRYVDPDQKWSVQEVVFPEQEAIRLSLQIDDGGRENKAEITFPGLTNYAIAADMARLILEKSRYQDSMSFKGDSSCFELEPGDNVYIDANILKFGTDPNANAIPWRIVSIKLNNDYTFDIGCVRNPDFMYPHVRVGEIDVVLPTFVPKGAEIYYPGNKRPPPVGLVPPTSADFPFDRNTGEPVITDPISNPPPTDGQDPVAGGGVGAPDGPVNGGGGVNTPPPKPAPIQELTDFIQVDLYRISGNATIGFYVYLDFKQPNNALYEGVDFYYKRSIASETQFQTKTELTKPGAGEYITAVIGPLIGNSTYIIKSRVKYSTGEYSKFAGTVNIPIVPGGSGNPVDYQETVTAGWLLNTEPAPLTYNNVFKSIDGRPIVSNPRRANITITQDINNYPITNQIAGVDIYYKPSASTFWEKEAVDFVAYIEGQPYTFEFPQTLGASGTNDKYDWVFRFRYTNGQQSIKQFRVMGADVELNTFGSRNFNIFTTVSPIAQGQEDVTAFNLLTTEDAPAGGGVADPREFQITVNQSKNLAVGGNAIGFHINPPVDPDNIWVGAKLYFKDNSVGSAKWNSVTVSPMTLNAGFYFISTIIKYNAQFEYILVPLVLFNGAKVNAFRGWYGKGSINFVAGTVFPNFWQQLNFRLENVAPLLQETVTGGVKTQAQVVEWSRNQTDGFGDNPRTLYFQVKYNAQNIGNFTRVEIYRRERNLNAQDPYQNYYGIGRWEKIVVGSGNSTTSNGVTTVNLRLPLNSSEFNFYYDAPSGATTTNTTNIINSLYTIRKPLSSVRTTNYEYVIATVTTTGTALQLLPHIPYISLTNKTSGFAYGQPINVSLAAYNLYPAEYLRNLNQAINSITTLSTLRYGTQQVTSLAVVPAGEPAVI